MDTMRKEQYESIFAHRKTALLKANEVEQDLNLTNGIIHQWIYRGTMPFPYVRAAGQIRIRKTAVIEWLMQSEVPANQRPVSASSSPQDAPRKKRGRKPRVADMARQAAQQRQTM